jgi:signal peptidase II
MNDAGHEHTPRAPFWLVVGLVAGLSLGADAWTKHWAQSELQHRPSKQLVVADGWLMLTYARNDAGAWGLLRSVERDTRLAALAARSMLSIVVLGALIYLCPREHLLAAGALAAIFAGAVGNVADRLHRGYVVDFIEWRKGVSWPIFNVADVAITTGVLILALLVLTDRTKPSPRKDP